MPQDITGDHSEHQGPPSDFSDAIFARRLREIRTQAGITQQQLAEQMAARWHKMHRSAIAKIESGDRPVTIGEAVQLAGIFGVSLIELIIDRGAADTERERQHRARVEAQIAVRSLQHEAAERHKLLQEQQLLYDHTVEKLKGARQRLADLGGELPTETPQLIEASIPMRPLHPGKDDQ